MSDLCEHNQELCRHQDLYDYVILVPASSSCQDVAVDLRSKDGGVLLMRKADESTVRESSVISVRGKIYLKVLPWKCYSMHLTLKNISNARSTSDIFDIPRNCL